MMFKKNKIVSIVISAYNEENNVTELYKQLNRELRQIKNIDFEFIYVDDGSGDNTYLNCKQLQNKDSRVKIVQLKRNFGHEIAMTAGMDYAKGDAVVFMDCDLQHPPVYIPQMVKLWQDGKEIVLTKRIDNKDTSKLYKLCAKAFYFVLNKLSDRPIMESAPDFRLLDRKYVDFLKSFNEQDRLFRGLLSWIMPQDNVEIIDFVAPERFSGQSKYNFFKSLQLAVNSIVQFSVLPLRIATYLGIIAAILALFMGLYVFVEYFLLNHPTPGYATIMVTVVFLGAIQLICLGIIGEYIGKIHMEVKKRPLYVADYIVKKGNTDESKKNI
ncbi:MAG: glycosyltransferase family 2 protein [Alphaproteobacteria bacterium]|nr:glycosyltransferase family 2 protein [Alphaproteobacteria bacterium]